MPAILAVRPIIEARTMRHRSQSKQVEFVGMFPLPIPQPVLHHRLAQTQC